MITEHYEPIRATSTHENLAALGVIELITIEGQRWIAKRDAAKLAYVREQITRRQQAVRATAGATYSSPQAPGWHAGAQLADLASSLPRVHHWDGHQMSDYEISLYEGV